MRKMIAAAALTALGACSAHPGLEATPLSDRQLHLEQFFNGPLQADGQFQDRFGKLRRRFHVAIDGHWDGQVLTLTENFVYEDGTTEQRIWTLHKTGPRTWEGTAPGVIGIARGEEKGDTFNWHYTIDLKVPGGTQRVTFDDWMWLMGDKALLNRAYVQKFGIDVGDLIISFRKGTQP
jgi:hypothetical protein